jgi:NitT/TauT family transport system substrate-binding protein
MRVARVACISALFAMLALCRSDVRAADEPLVRAGYNPLGAGNTIFFIADRLGYFRSEGINVDLLPFDSSINQVAPLATGQLDVAGASPSGAFYNEIARGNGMRVVADLGRNPPGYGFDALLVRSQLIKSGRYKSVKDLKGMRIAIVAPGTASWATLVVLLRKAGLSYHDIKPLVLKYSEHLAALRDGTVDASFMPEPGATQIVRSGVASRVASNDDFYINQEIVVVMYSASFIKNRSDLALKFMRAFIKAARFYNDALAGGRFVGPNADAVVKILTDATPIKDPGVIRASVPYGTDPNGRLNVNSMRQDLATFRDFGFTRGPLKVEQAIDASFAAQAVRELGPYKPAGAGPRASWSGRSPGLSPFS